MKILSPTDCIGPAFRRTREVLFAPFRLGFFLKIALVAALTQPTFYSVLISYPAQGAQAAASMAASRHQRTMDFAAWQPGIGTVAGIVILAILVLVGFAVWVGCIYFLCRLRFTLFDLVVYKQGSVRGAWAKYGRQTWRYFCVMVLASLVFLVVAVIALGPLFVRMVKTISGMAVQGPNPNPFPMFAAMLPLMGVMLLLAFLWVIVDTVLQDFVLPPMAIDDAPIEAAFRRFFELLKDGPGTFLGYLLLRFVLSIGLSWALVIILGIALLVLGSGGVLLGLLLYHLMWHGGIALQVGFIVIAAIMALALLLLYFVVMIAIYGTVAVLKESYAVYFFGSRYPELGNRLEPPEEEPVATMVEPPLPPLPPLQEPPPVW
jgi:hypothetical protein